MGLLPTLQRAAWGGAQGPCTPGGRPRTVGGTLTPRSALPGKATGHCRGAPREAPRPLGQRWSAAASSLTRPPLCSLRCGRGPRACPQVGRWGPQAGSSRLPGRRGVCFQPSAPLLGPVHPPPAAPLRGRRHLPGDHGPQPQRHPHTGPGPASPLAPLPTKPQGPSAHPSCRSRAPGRGSAGLRALSADPPQLRCLLSPPFLASKASGNI